MSKRHYLDLGPTAELKLTPRSDYEMKIKGAQLRAREQRWAAVAIKLPLPTGKWTLKQRIKRWWRNP